MGRDDPYAHATRAAELVVKERGITVLPVDPIAIALDLKIEVVAKPATRAGVSGMFLRVGNNFGIAYATHIKSEGFRRFSVAHELGHYFLPGHVDAVLGGNDAHESRAGFASGDRYELEADHFAAGLLMPHHFFYAEMRRLGDGLAAIEDLSGICRTSLTATAIRFVQCTSDPVAVVLSTGNQIDYCVMSNALKDVNGIDWIRRRQVVPRSVPTFNFNQDARRVERGERLEATSNLQDWFGGRRSVEIAGDVVGLGSYGKTLSILYGIEVSDESEGNQKEELEESWTPRFRR